MMASNSDRYSMQERGWEDAIAFVRAVLERIPIEPSGAPIGRMCNIESLCPPTPN